MIKRNIDNLPNPVAARRLIRHQRKCVPVPSHAHDRFHLAEPGREFSADRRQAQRGHPPPDAGIIVHGPRVGHEAAFHGKRGIGRDIEIKGIGFLVCFENRPVGRRAIRRERIAPEGKASVTAASPAAYRRLTADVSVAAPTVSGILMPPLALTAPAKVPDSAVRFLIRHFLLA